MSSGNVAVPLPPRRGRAHRTQAPTHRLSPPIDHHQGDDRRGLQGHSPTRERYVAKPYPKDNEPRTVGIRQAWLDAGADHIPTNGIGHDDLLVGSPISRNTFRTRIWLPAVKVSGIDFGVRVHDLRHAHASWLLTGGDDLKSVMDGMGHCQIQATQKYLHTLPDTDQRNLDALTRTQSRPS